MQIFNRAIIIFSLYTVSYLLCSFSLFSQEIITDSSYFKKKDTVCSKYNFNPGDTLYYYVVAFDSIIIDYDIPLKRSRFERIRIICDSIWNKHFFLRQTLVEFMARESRGDINNVERKNSPWIGRDVWFEIDSLGRRYSYGVDDENLGAMSPGGAFNPIFLVNIGKSCKAVNETWIVKDTIAVPENGIPVPLVRNTLLFRAKSTYDTLGVNCNKFEYVNTGQGTIKVKSDLSNITVNSVHNGHGNISISSKHHHPVHSFSTIELKLKIIDENGNEKPGWHYIHCNYTLDRYIPAKKQ